MYRYNHLSAFTMNKKFFQMMLVSAVVSVCFCSCDHVSFVHHVNSHVAARPVVYRPVVHKEVVVHHPAPQPVVVHKPAPQPKQVAKNKPVNNHKHVAQNKPQNNHKHMAQRKREEKRPAARRA